MRIKLFSILLLLITALNFIYSQEAVVIKEESVNYISNDNKSLKLIPQSSMKEKIINTNNNLEYNLGVEVIFSFKKPEFFKNNPNEILMYFNMLSKIKSLEGIQYYSESKNRIRTLFTKSFVTDDKNNMIPDPVYTSVPEAKNLKIMQEDTSFGENYYIYKYSSLKNEILIEISNTTDLWFGIIKMCEKQNLHMNFLIIPEKDSVKIYGSCLLKTVSLPFLDKRAQVSFYNRIVAMKNWFQGNLSASLP